MIEYRIYACDFGHTWEIEKDVGSPELEEETVCSQGHPAVTMRREFPVDLATVVLEPAERIIDRVTGQTTHDSKVNVIVKNLENEEVSRTARPLLWREARRILEQLVFKSPDEARAIIEARNSD